MEPSERNKQKECREIILMEKKRGWMEQMTTKPKASVETDWKEVKSIGGEEWEDLGWIRNGEKANRNFF